MSKGHADRSCDGARVRSGRSRTADDTRLRTEHFQSLVEGAATRQLKYAADGYSRSALVKRGKSTAPGAASVFVAGEGRGVHISDLNDTDRPGEVIT
jgi:hypothetical protein